MSSKLVKKSYSFYSKELKSKKYSPSDIKIILKEMKKYQKKIKKN